MMRRSMASRGFTLIETLVSLVIATIAITGFYNALSTGALLDRRASIQAEQIFVATSILDSIGVERQLRAGITDNGTLRGFDWSLVITNRATDDMRLGAAPNERLAYVFVTVTPQDGRGNPVTLRSVRYWPSPL